jgi:hypothetical protein
MRVRPRPWRAVVEKRLPDFVWFEALPRGRELSRLRDGLEAERESFGARRGGKPDGYCGSENHLVAFSGHSL